MPHVDNQGQYSKTDETVGGIIQKLFRFMYNFYFVCSLIGVAGYFLNLQKLVYACALLCIVVFVVQLFIASTFKSGMIFLPLGAAGVYFLFDGTIGGVCLGIFIVFIIRHLIRNVFYKLIGKLVSAASR